MRVAIPHTLGREEVRRRLRARSGEVAGFIPGGLATVTTDWPDEDRMHMGLSAMGHTVNAHVDVEDAAMVITLDLPDSLSFVRGMVEAAVREKGTKLLR
ncbi:MAG: polyhydroxyalkanoic acid system family protein [Sphingomonadales bacterium]|nr:polyhydroxyalkanoic acid system family protein [Sphingomonadales bacterium]MDE2568831.1 polyhydroxyalkanoic acid system family protein [Sphingomonadales bacterium]